MKSPLLLPSAILLILLLLTAPLPAATTTGHPGSVAVLLGLDSVRNELKLTKSQCDQLDKIRSNFKADAHLITTRPPATQVEKSAANSTVKSLINRYNEKAVAVLTPQQHARLVQIERQILGGLMLFQPDEQKLLGLSSSQIAALGQIRSNGEAFASRVTNSFEKGNLTLQERLATLRNYRIKQSAKCLQVLSPAQRKAFRSLQGTTLKRA
ncbi:MAG: hypothetical protein WCO94_06435 [Verrucomicrobiota bacterium]